MALQRKFKDIEARADKPWEEGDMRRFVLAPDCVELVETAGVALQLLKSLPSELERKVDEKCENLCVSEKKKKGRQPTGARVYLDQIIEALRDEETVPEKLVRKVKRAAEDTNAKLVAPVLKILEEALDERPVETDGENENVKFLRGATAYLQQLQHTIEGARKHAELVQKDPMNAKEIQEQVKVALRFARAAAGDDVEELWHNARSPTAVESFTTLAEAAYDKNVTHYLVNPPVPRLVELMENEARTEIEPKLRGATEARMKVVQTAASPVESLLPEESKSFLGAALEEASNVMSIKTNTPHRVREVAAIGALMVLHALKVRVCGARIGVARCSAEPTRFGVAGIDAGRGPRAARRRSSRARDAHIFRAARRCQARA